MSTSASLFASSEFVTRVVAPDALPNSWSSFSLWPAWATVRMPRALSVARVAAGVALAQVDDRHVGGAFLGHLAQHDALVAEQAQDCRSLELHMRFDSKAQTTISSLWRDRSAPCRGLCAPATCPRLEASRIAA